jgi:hypothetical protein
MKGGDGKMQRHDEAKEVRNRRLGLESTKSK